MKKSPDKLFHLSIGVIGICLTVISVLSIIYQVMPAGLRNLFPTSQTTAVFHSMDNQTVDTPHTVIHVGQKTGATSTNINQSSTKQSNVLSQEINVKSYGSGVGNQAVKHVEKLIAQATSPVLIHDTLQLSLKHPMTIELVADANSYTSALEQLGVDAKTAQNLAGSTGGFTQNSTVIIPLNQNAEDTDLVNTITHEMTHVFLNQNVGTLPSWLNEGIAVYMGMRGQKQIESAVSFAGYERQSAEDILDVAAKGNLAPLTGDENVILDGQANYDYELQDWLAVCDLISKHGITALDRYLTLLSHHAPESQAFIVAFHIREDIFNLNLTKLLKQAANASDEGIQLDIHIAPGYSGDVQFLQHGTATWHGMAGTTGDYVVTLTPDGSLVGNVDPLHAVADPNPPDDRTVYVSLMPKSPLTYKGQRVTDCGMAFDYHDGLYAFEDSWITFANGQTTYLSTPSMFGLSIENATEANQSNPICELFEAE